MSLRVAHVLRKLDPAEWSGTEMAIHRLVDGLRAHDVLPTVFCPRALPESPNGTGEDPLTRSGFEVRRFRAFVPVLGLSRQRRRQLVSVGGNLMSFDLVPALWRLKQLSLIHAHTLGRLGGIALRIAKQRQIPFVVTIHGGVFDLPEKVKLAFQEQVDCGWEWGRFFGWLFQSHRLFCDAAAILTCNTREAALLQEKFPGKKIVVQPHGVPLEVYRNDDRETARAAFPQIIGRELLLCLGRIDPIKNQAWLIEQAPAVFERHPRAVLVLAGPCTDKPYGEVISGRIRELGLKDRVLLTGGLPPNDPRLIGLLQSAEVLLLPSLSETFGLVILEAWAAGTLTISARASGPAALIQHGHNGWLFDLDHPQGLHETLDQTLARPDLARQMVERGAQLAEAYDVHALAGRLKLLYQDVIEEKQCVT
jgi:alpha-maltose-1-phosphate synthase